LSELWLEYHKKSIEFYKYEKEEDIVQAKKMIKIYQMKVYQSISAEENAEQKMQEFLDKEGLTKEDLVYMTPIMLIGKHPESL